MQPLARLLLVVIVVLPPWETHAWGGLGHKEMTRLTLRSLSEPTRSVYAPIHEAVVEGIMDPDERVKTSSTERPRHYLDLEVLGLPFPDVTRSESPFDDSPGHRKQLLGLFRTQYKLKPEKGMLPLAVEESFAELVKAMKKKDQGLIIRYTTDLLHYVQDAHQPLHATDAHDGLFAAQKGVHRGFETAMVERCQEALPRKAGKVNLHGEPVAELMMLVLLESHSQASSVLAADLGCERKGKDGVVFCGTQVPQQRKEDLGCQPLSGIAQKRMELAAGRGAALLHRAMKMSHLP